MLLTPIEAEKQLEIGVKLTPGAWGQHSISVGTNARLIAESVLGMDSDIVYIMGLMHYIGRRAGIKGILHILMDMII